MSKTSPEREARVVALLRLGRGLRETQRLSGVAVNTIKRIAARTPFGVGNREAAARGAWYRRRQKPRGAPIPWPAEDGFRSTLSAFWSVAANVRAMLAPKVRGPRCIAWDSQEADEAWNRWRARAAEIEEQVIPARGYDYA